MTDATTPTSPGPAQGGPVTDFATFQRRNVDWMAHTFDGVGDPTDLNERRDRFAEEAMELIQATGGTLDGVIAQARYTFSRPKGEPEQEAGGTLTTLSCLLTHARVDMVEAGEAELARCCLPETIAKVRRKRANRHGRGVLPGDDADFVSPAPAHRAAAPVAAGPADAVAGGRLADAVRRFLEPFGATTINVRSDSGAISNAKLLRTALERSDAALADPDAGRAGGFRVGISTMRESDKGESYTVTLYHPKRPKDAGILDGEGRMEVYTTYERENAEHCAGEWREFFAKAPLDRGEGAALPGVEETRCPDCDGLGQISPPNMGARTPASWPCRTCHGTGRLATRCTAPEEDDTGPVLATMSRETAGIALRELDRRFGPIPEGEGQANATTDEPVHATEDLKRVYAAFKDNERRREAAQAAPAAGDGLREAAQTAVTAWLEHEYGSDSFADAMGELKDALASAAGGGGASFQARNAAWMAEVMRDDPTDLAERVHRFTEEALEFGQALGQTCDEVRQIADYVHGRPKGDPTQEAGGTKTTLALLCAHAGIDMDAAGEAELARCSTPEIVAKIREKRSKRHGRGPLPGSYAPDFVPVQTGGEGGEWRACSVCFTPDACRSWQTCGAAIAATPGAAS